MVEFDKVGVVGAGMMGSEIALMFALSGYPTLLSDLSPDAAKHAVERLHGVLDRGLPRGFWSEDAAETARRQLSIANSLEDYDDCGFVIEAVFENEDLKRDVFRKLDAILGPVAPGLPRTHHPYPSQSPKRGASRAPASPFRRHAFSSHPPSDAACRGHSGRAIPIRPLSTPSKTMVAIGKALMRG